MMTVTVDDLITGLQAIKETHRERGLGDGGALPVVGYNDGASTGEPPDVLYISKCGCCGQSYVEVRV